MSRKISTSTPTGPRVIVDYATDLEAACARTRLIFSATKLALASKQITATTIGPYAPRDSMAGDPASPSGTKVELSELADDVLNAIIAAGATGSTRTPYREFDITSPLVTAGDVLNIQTGAFSVAGAQATFASYDTPTLPATAIEFRDNTLVRVWVNGVIQSKGAIAGDGRDVHYVDPVSVAFGLKLRAGDIVRVESLSAF